MPPDNQNVIVTIKWKDEKRIEFEVFREDGKWKQYYDSMDGGGIEYYSDDEVTHWIPCPKPAED